jgi:hypothetical protein
MPTHRHAFAICSTQEPARQQRLHPVTTRAIRYALSQRFAFSGIVAIARSWSGVTFLSVHEMQIGNMPAASVLQRWWVAMWESCTLDWW